MEALLHVLVHRQAEGLMTWREEEDGEEEEKEEGEEVKEVKE